MENKGIAKSLFAELFGTFALVFSIIVVVTMYAPESEVSRGQAYPFIALAHGFVLFLLIQTLGGVSGAHFNPAVTLGLLVIRQIKAAHAALYMVVQVIGAIVAALLASALIPKLAETVNYAATTVGSNISVGAAIMLEAIFTFFLVWTIVGTAVDPKGSREWAPLAISGTLTLGVLLIAPMTGAGINPARSIGPALISGEWGAGSDFLFAYVIGPLAGGLVAALLYGGLFLSSSDGGGTAVDDASEKPSAKTST